jgi:hypothetical protein
MCPRQKKIVNEIINEPFGAVAEALVSSVDLTLLQIWRLDR